MEDGPAIAYYKNFLCYKNPTQKSNAAYVKSKNAFT